MQPEAGRIRVGISACLLGHHVRYNGGHKRDALLVETFGPFVEWVPVCPEVELGLGTPRPTLRLKRHGGDLRLIMPSTGADYTAAMRAYAKRRVAKLRTDDLCCYILKQDSPSCGMERVKVYGVRNVPSNSGRGVFAAALLQRFPHMPIEEEGRLNDPRRRDNFIERVFAYRGLRSLFRAHWTVGGLVAFHGAHRLQLLAHSPTAYERLGRSLAGAKTRPRAALRDDYEAQFMSALDIPATPKRHANVLQHIAGYFKKQLDDDSRHELLSLIDDYRRGLVPLIVPVTLVGHYVHRFEVSYLKGQTYLEPQPKELMLRKHV